MISYPSRHPWYKGTVALAAIVIVMFAIVLPMCSNYFKTRDRTVVVNQHERVCDHDQSGCQYLIFTDGGTYKLTDSIFIGRFNSSDMYGRIKDGHKYHITYYGIRFGCTSMYPNIKTMEEV